ncbi:O-antigen ligase family protein [Microbacterium murale]|uniref:O-antigen ligase-related domain-containing protein n=1 Tax=Microbacterium murale TaxID=1081040 RepID=A0ABU0PB80_9MICO|nr:O-antigen ligase family protein [Microbacterium murale]MDQ0644595.1 hypothetical protein [Microbacterium murale]
MGIGGDPSRRRSGIRRWLAELWADAWRWALFAIAVIGAVYFVLERGLANGAITAIVIGVLMIAAVITWSMPIATMLMATPAIFVVERIGLGGGDLTVSDAALATGFGVAVLLGHHEHTPPMRAMLRLNLVYQFSTVFTVIINPFQQNLIEWVHAWLLISGALILGWAIGRAGKAPIAMRLILIVGAVIAAGTLLTAGMNFARGDLGPVYPAWPWPMHKNFAGGALAFVAFAAWLNPDWMRVPKRWARITFGLCVVALLLTQSRQAIIGFIVVMLIYVLRQGGAKHWVLAFLLALPGVVLLVQSVVEQIESQDKYNSVYQRLNWLQEVYHLWLDQPLVGHGLRYWYVHPTANFQPPQAELEVIASAGVVGLVGFTIMWVGFIVVLWRVDPRFGMLALGSVLARIVQAQFDLFWVSAQVSIPFLIAGICLGAQAFEAAQAPRESEPAAFTRVRKIKSKTLGGTWNSATIS